MVGSAGFTFMGKMKENHPFGARLQHLTRIRHIIVYLKIGRTTPGPNFVNTPYPLVLLRSYLVKVTRGWRAALWSWRGLNRSFKTAP